VGGLIEVRAAAFVSPIHSVECSTRRRRADGRRDTSFSLGARQVRGFKFSSMIRARQSS